MGNKLKALLIQLPPSFKYNSVNLERIEKMAKYLPKNGPALVFEFRDDSWFIPEVYKVFKKYNLCLGGTAIKRPTKRYWLGNLPTGVNIPPKTSSTTYLRVHGEKGYKKYYSDKELTQIKSKILRNKTKQNFIMFNNTFFTVFGLGKHVISTDTLGTRSSSDLQKIAPLETKFFDDFSFKS